MKKYLIYILFLVISFPFFWSCATVGSLSGGEKDEIPPRFIGSKPERDATDFEGKSFQFVFDEYFELEDAENLFLSSPPLEEKPDLKIKGKSLYIKLNSPLLDSTTYRFNLGNAIADYHEKNKIDDFNFVFSTGSVVDSFQIAGSVYNVFDLEPLENVFVMAYSEYTDSLPYLQKPNYITRIDTSGNFVLPNLPNNTYKLFVLNDLNMNLLYDMQGESIGFDDNQFTTSSEVFTQIDSLKAGTILHDINHPELSDSLEMDSVIIQQKVKYLPNDIALFAFIENKVQQKLISYTRPSRSKLVFGFRKPTELNTSFELLNAEQQNAFVQEINATKDSVIFWIKDTSISQIDSLSFLVSYASTDSIEQVIRLQDTVAFKFSDPKTDDTKSKKNKKTTITKTIIKPHMALSCNAKKDFDLFETIQLRTQHPISLIDRKQVLQKAVRTSRSQCFFAFSRPITNDLQLVLPIYADHNWYRVTADTEHRRFWVEITEDSIAALDSVRFDLIYDNQYFHNELRTHRARLKLGIRSQKRISQSRILPNELRIALATPVQSDVKVSFRNPSTSTGFGSRLSASRDTVIVSLTATSLINTDTIAMGIEASMGEGLDEVEVLFVDTFSVVYKPIEQKILHADRTDNGLIRIRMQKSMIGSMQLKGLNFTANDWYKPVASTSPDSMFFQLTDKAVEEKDSVLVLATFEDEQRSRLTLTDTLYLPIAVRSKNIGGSDESITIEESVAFEFYADSTNLRHYHVRTDWKEAANYRLVVDSTAFTDIFEWQNDSLQVDFNVQSNDYYGKIKLLVNLTARDSLPMRFPVEFEHLVVQLLDEEENVLKEYAIANQDSIVFDFLAPASYKLKVIFDTNNDGKWTTGDYLKHIQPEKVMYYPNLIELVSNFENEIEWFIGVQLQSDEVNKKPLKEKK